MKKVFTIFCEYKYGNGPDHLVGLFSTLKKAEKEKEALEKWARDNWDDDSPYSYYIEERDIK